MSIYAVSFIVLCEDWRGVESVRSKNLRMGNGNVNIHMCIGIGLIERIDQSRRVEFKPKRVAVGIRPSGSLVPNSVRHPKHVLGLECNVLPGLGLL